jgi:hypothetical protein
MSVFLQPIYTQTVGSGGAATVTFNNIPQTFTDLKLVASARTSRSALADDFGIRFNSQTTTYSVTAIQGSGTAASSFRVTGSSTVSNLIIDGNTATANTFASTEAYIPNYTSTNFKSITVESVQESNGAESYMRLVAGLWQNTAAITSISLIPDNNFLQYSTFTLYGITRG